MKIDTSITLSDSELESLIKTKLKASVSAELERLLEGLVKEQVHNFLYSGPLNQLINDITYELALKHAVVRVERYFSLKENTPVIDGRIRSTVDSLKEKLAAICDPDNSPQLPG